MIEKIVLATGNKGKLREFRGLLEGVFGNIVSLNDLESPPEVTEDGETFRENALKKARAIAAYSGIPALADDSGLEVEALGGRPGVYSARYAGEGAVDTDNIAKLLSELQGVANRKARFVCFLALVTPDGKEITAEGTCEGVILTEPRGEGGFGYDPVFFLPEYDKTMAEIPAELKNKKSHRARASESLAKILRGM
jgi:XTP/dITP diphosphohydrolase